MKPQTILSLFLMTFFVFLTHCSQKAKVQNTPSSGSWPRDMQSLAQNLKSLFPFLLSPKKFESPENREKIESQLNNFSQLTHGISEKTPPTDSDPTLRIVAGEFELDVARSQQAFSEGHYEYSRKTLLSATMYCIQCHTRNTQGPKFPLQDLWTEWPTEDTIEKIEFMISLRQFEPALKEISEFLKRDRASLKNPFDWDKVAQYGLQVSLRALSDTKMALGFVDSILKSPGTPVMLKENARNWKKSLLALKSSKTPVFKSTQSRLDYAKKMISIAQKGQEYPLDRNGDVEFLIASRELHEVLGQNPSPAMKAEALYYLGLCYDVIKDAQMWSLSESFYEGCIHLQPGTSLAQQCYKNYETSQKMGYSGSGGLLLPPEVKKKLTQLKTMADGELPSKTENPKAE